MSTRFAAFVALPLVAFSIWSWYELRQALPPTGSLRLNGISAPVEIARDLHGVPTINAAKERDAFFAVGLLHAQDRLWQLEILRRTASGRLSEVLGSGSLPWDLWARSLDLYGSAQQSLAALSEGAAASLSSYADGVNEGIRTARGLPPEFLALGLQPEPWSVVDSLAVVKMFEFRLSGNFRSELRNSAARNMLADDLLKVLLPNLAGSEMFDERRDRAPLDLSIFGLAAFVEGYTAPSSRYAGSNAWAVAAPQGQSGGALLANDPHLALQIPSPWYVVAIDTPQLSVSGMGLVGTPLVFMGRNRSITWGITNLGADTQDLYYELVDSRDPTKYDLLDSWVAFETRTEEISIREDFPKILNRSFKPVTRVFRKSTNGPIINDLASFSPSPLALQWTGFSADDASYEAFYRLSYARDWAEFRSAVSLLVAPSLNFFYADQAGNIGYQAAGRIPIRNMGTGVLPVQRGRSDAFWTGYIPFDAMPRDYNPETGYVINSNNLVSSSTGEYFLSHEWAESGRHDRIKMLLDGLRADPHRAIDVKSMMAIQLDTVDLVARRMLPLLSTVTPTDEQSARALAYIKEWDGDMSKSSVAASIFHTWMMELRRGLFEDDLKQAVGSDQLPALLQQLMDDFGLSALADVLEQPDSPWCDDVRTTPVESCAETLSASLKKAVEDLSKLAGADLREWRWGDIHFAHYGHVSFASRGVLGSIFDRRLSSGGSANTVNVADALVLKDEIGAGRELYSQNLGASFRQIVRLDGETKDHVYMNMSGQSESLLSSHYDDMTYELNQGAYNSLPESASESAAARTTLVPIP